MHRKIEDFLLQYSYFLKKGWRFYINKYTNTA